MDEGLERRQAASRPYPGATATTWMGPQYNLTNAQGLLTQADGVTPSRVVHQADRFGMYYWHKWLGQQAWVQDELARELNKKK